MPLTLDTTVGGASANSYVPLEVALAYFEGRVGGDAWITSDDATRARALVTATSRLEQERYVGEQATEAQRLLWPRAWVPTGECTPVYHPADAIPRLVQEACCEWALVILQAGAADPFAATGLEGFQDITLGSIAITPDNGGLARHRMPAQVERLLRRYLAAGQLPTRIVRG